MTLRLTNTLTRRTEEFQSLKPNEVSIYCCGVTVYDDCHVGHARSYIVWDILRRYLIWIGYKVTFVQNFTDIDDKILKRAASEGCSMSDVSERNIKSFFQDMEALGILRPDRMPRATRSLNSIRNLIAELETKGIAYSIEGDVYFQVMKYSEYGKLSGRELKSQIMNADGRIGEVETSRKRHSFDFALWKAAKPGEPSFPSPWGLGRPGWHIECSAMVRDELGDTIDIHLGGADLVFPHHENEIAQSEAATGKSLARFWLHNGMVNVGGDKMSKSLGNFITIKSLLAKGISPMTIRLFVLQANYRKPLDFTKDALDAAATGWKGLNTALCLGITYKKTLCWPDSKDTFDITRKSIANSIDKTLMQLLERFSEAMDDDLNSSGALAVIFELARPLRALANKLERGEIIDDPENKDLVVFLRWKLLLNLSNVLGLTPEMLKDIKNKKNSIDKNNIQKAISMRKEAKLAKDFVKADQIRDQLREKGVELIDKSGGTTDWIYL